MRVGKCEKDSDTLYRIEDKIPGFGSGPWSTGAHLAKSLGTKKGTESWP